MKKSSKIILGTLGLLGSGLYIHGIREENKMLLEQYNILNKHLRKVEKDLENVKEGLTSFDDDLNQFDKNRFGKRRSKRRRSKRKRSRVKRRSKRRN